MSLEVQFKNHHHHKLFESQPRHKQLTWRGGHWGWGCGSPDCPAGNPRKQSSSECLRMRYSVCKDRIEICPWQIAQTMMKARLKGAPTGHKPPKERIPCLHL